MPTMEVATGSLKLCQQAQDQLLEAIDSVLKAEQQLRENTREVRKVFHLHLLHLSHFAFKISFIHSKPTRAAQRNY